MHIKVPRNSSDLISTLAILPNSLKSQLCLESLQVPKPFTWFPLSPISCCKETWMVTPTIATFCIKRESFLFLPCSSPSLFLLPAGYLELWSKSSSLSTSPSVCWAEVLTWRTFLLWAQGCIGNWFLGSSTGFLLLWAIDIVSLFWEKDWGKLQSPRYSICLRTHFTVPLGQEA